MGVQANAGQRDASAPWDLPSEPIWGPGLDAQGAGDLLAAGQLEIEREKAGWDQQGPPSGATPGLVSLQEFSLVIFQCLLSSPGWWLEIKGPALHG